MRAINLLTLAQGLEAVPAELLVSFEAQLCEREDPLDSVKPHEAACIEHLVDWMRSAGASDARDFEGFAYSFRIPQISSEFDLLKVTDDAVLNIELKAEQVGEERIKRQLTRNRYYLGPLGRTIHTFTFVLEPQSLFELQEDGTLVPVGIERLVEVAHSLTSVYAGPLEALFRASDYLVSPLNDTQEFLEGRYFLTSHQEQIKSSFLKACARHDAAVPPAYLVYGSSGTGKSLLLYDLARSLGTPRPVCVVHCGILAPGHQTLNQSQRGFEVVTAKGSEHLDLTAYGAVLVDEAQRMWPSQLRSVAQTARQQGLPLFLSLDYQQVLGQTEERQEAETIVRNFFPSLITWRLSRKIRTNRGLTGFIRTLFGLRGHKEKARTRHVKIAYARDAAQALELVEAFRSDGYECIRLGLDTQDALAIPGCPATNEVVGQEFDRVVMALGPGFLTSGATSREAAIYREHVFQGLTRARSDLALVVYQNTDLLAYLLNIVA